MIQVCEDVFSQQIKRLEVLQKEWSDKVAERTRAGCSPAYIRAALSKVFMYEDMINQTKTIQKQKSNNYGKNVNN